MKSVEPIQLPRPMAGKTLPLLGALAVTLWIGVLGTYVFRNRSPETAHTVTYEELQAHHEEQRRRDPTIRHEYLGMYRGDAKVGYVLTTLQWDEAERVYRADDTSLLRIAMLGTEQEVKYRLRAVLEKDFTMRTSNIDLEAAGVEMKVQAALRGDKVEVLIDSVGGRDFRTIKVDQPPQMPVGIMPYLAKRGFPSGESFSFEVFNPISAVQGSETWTVRVLGKETLTIDGEEKPLHKVATTYQGTETLSWVDEVGVVWREQSPMGFVLKRESLEDALMKGWRKDTNVNLIDSISVPVGDRFRGARPVRKAVMRISSSALAGWNLGAPNQQWEPPRLTVTATEPPKDAGYTLPYAKAQYARYLKPEPFIQSDDERIVKTAKGIVGDRTDPRKAARALYDWAWDNIDKQATISIPSATDVLTTMRGDCNEHAVLLAALARAAGIPAKVLTGLVHQDGRMYYHAWNAVWLGEWVAVDAALGQWPADATHIQLVEGGLEAQSKIMQLIGRLEIAVEKVQ